MLDKQLIINANSSETRIALLEKEQVAEVFIERHRERAIVGNIYKGVVNRVLPGMQSAFINIGTDRSAFLYGGDVVSEELLRSQKTEVDEDIGPEEVEKKLRAANVPIEKNLREGDQILVQIAKEPLGTKGARVTMYLSLPGRYLVLMPGFSHIGISRRIENEEERTRLKSLIREIKPDGIGVIVRTAANGADGSHLQKEMKYLLAMWAKVQGRANKQSAPSLVYRDLDLIQKTTRDLYSEEIHKIVVDHPAAFEDLRKFLEATIPGAARKLELYDKKIPVFDVYGIEMDISRALGSKIELPSGGYLVIDQTEALTSFDINTGKFVGKLSAQETIFRTNMEAIKKIVAQLRIRNIGGIIVIDFIDMERADDRDRVYNALQEELKTDKARTNVLRISELGLVQMTRKRTSESLERQLTEPCIYCEGRGRVRSTATEAYDLLREVMRRSIQTGQSEIKVKVREDIKDWILEEERELFEELTVQHNIRIEFVASELSVHALHEAPFEVLSSGS